MSTHIHSALRFLAVLGICAVLLLTSAWPALAQDTRAATQAKPIGLTGTPNHEMMSRTWYDRYDDPVTGCQTLRFQGFTTSAAGLFVLVDDVGSADQSYADASLEVATGYVPNVTLPPRQARRRAPGAAAQRPRERCSD